MAIKNLNQFKKPVQIELEMIQKDWKLQVVNQEPYYQQGDTNRNNPLGIRTTVVVIEDSHDYGKEKGVGLNLFEKLNIKTPNEDNPVQFTQRQQVTLFSLSKATIYGDYQNQLSLEGVLMDTKEYNNRLKQPKN